MEIKMITKHDQDIVFAVEHIKQHPCGYMCDLVKHIAPEIISELKSIGLLKSGDTDDGPTYAITKFGRNYADVIVRKSR